MAIGPFTPLLIHAGAQTNPLNPRHIYSPDWPLRRLKISITVACLEKYICSLLSSNDDTLFSSHNSIYSILLVLSVKNVTLRLAAWHCRSPS